MTTRRRGTAFIALLAGLVLAAGCGLPMPEGVRTAGDVPAGSAGTSNLQVLPAGPRPGATPDELVAGFLAAQTSPDGGYAVAREFLAPGTVWDPAASVLLYESGTQSVKVDPDEPSHLSVLLRVTGRISADGTFSLPPQVEPVREGPFTVVAVGRAGQLRLSGVPPGVRLADTERAGSYVPRNVYFLGRAEDGSATSHLVADREFQLTTREPARALVEALLSGPTQALSGATGTGAVVTAVPNGTRLRGLDVQDGVVSVDLSGEVLQLDERERQQLSAQFVWTLLPTFRGVRLLVDGALLPVEGAGQVQVRQDWSEYDPSGLGEGEPLLYIADRRLRSLSGALDASEVTGAKGKPVDSGALAPGSRTLAVLTDAPDGGDDVVRAGPLSGPFVTAFARPSLTSLSWGSGDRGLWLLQTGVRSTLWLLPGPGVPTSGSARPVTYGSPLNGGPLSDIAVSRDGARIAMVFGTGTARRLYVGRIQPGNKGLEVTRPVAVAPAVTNVIDVAWESETSLVALGSLGGKSDVLGLRLAIDGSSLVPINTSGLPTGGAVTIAAAPDKPIRVGIDVDGRPQLYTDSGALFRLEQAGGGAPFYPG